jgi:hypothetical protein
MMWEFRILRCQAELKVQKSELYQRHWGDAAVFFNGNAFFGLDPPVEYSVNHYTAKDNHL